MKLISRSLAGFLSALVVVLAIFGIFHLTSWGKDAGPAIKVDTTTSLGRSSPGTGFSKVELIQLKMVVFAPIPNASVRMASTAKPGAFAIIRRL